jgi:hypothetical protein
MYKYLNFFDKKGEYCNFEYLEASDKWVGRIDFNTVSEGLIEDFQLYIMEEVYNSTSQSYEYAYPIGSTSLPSNGATAYFTSTNPIKEIFLYDFDLGATANTLTKSYSMGYDLGSVAYSIGTSGVKDGIKEVTTINSIPIQVNLGFSPMTEKGYSSVVFIKDASDNVFAEILLYGEGEEEDQRLRDWLAALGGDLLPQDESIFDESDVNEIKTNWSLFNKKRKEMLLEYSNIYPYLGSYKALINIIKFFGYQNLRMKEYWLNVDSESLYFGKFKQMNIADVFTKDANFNNTSLIPSKIYKKTNKFGLYYDITVESGEYDDDGIPIVEEVFSFSPHEILIKIFALKKKLQNYFLPVNAKIVDIIGEAVYFAKYDTNVWNDQYRIDKIDLGLKPSFEVLPSTSGFLQDLRYLNFFGCPVGPDLTIGGQTNILSWKVTLNPSGINVGGMPTPLDTIQTFRFVFYIPTGTTATIDTIIQRDPDTGKYIYTNAEVADLIIESLRDDSYVGSNFTIYQEGGDSGTIRIVQKEAIGDGSIYVTWMSNTSGSFPQATTQYTVPTISAGGGTASSINVSTGPSGSFGATGAPISYFADCFLGYFDKANIPIRQLNDDEDIPIGYPITLNNKTFDINWDDANVTYNQIDLVGPTSGTLYGSFNLSQIISGWTSSAGSTSNPVYVGVTGFPTLFPSQFNYSWQSLGYYGYYEIQWIVTKVADDTPAFSFDSGKISIEDGDNYPVILPYVGFYKVELYMWDGYNTKSFLINEDMIEVKMKESDFIGWYQYRELDYKFDTRKYDVQLDFIPPPPLNGITPLKPLLTWDEYASTWDLPLHPNESMDMADMSYNSLDSAEFYKTITDPSNNPLVDRFPYTYNLMSLLPKWDDLYHLWWDGIGTKITQWEIKDMIGSTAHIFMTRGNTILDIDSINVYYESGPIGYTGATGATTAIGNTGDIIVSNANRRTYQWNGTEWAYIIDVVDSYEIKCLTGSTAENLISIADELNSIMILDNSGLDITWNDFPFTYNEIDYLDNSGVPLFGPFTLSQTIASGPTGWTSIYPHPDLPAGATYISIPIYVPVPGFPSPLCSNDFIWNSLGYEYVSFEKKHPILSDFIYYYDEDYDANYQLKPYIRAVSKNFDKGGRHKIKLQGVTGDNKSYETVNFGYVGDIPSFFEIYKVESLIPTGSILINGMSSPYLIGSTSLMDLANELNGPTAQAIDGINNFQYNLVLGYSGATGPTTSSITPTEIKIQAISKSFTSPEELIVDLVDIVGTSYGRSIIKNPTWDEVRILKYAQNLPLCTVVNFTYDNSIINGKKNPKWKLTKEGDSNFTDIYYNNKYFSYMFNEKGSYTVSLELEDTNGNKKSVTKKEIIKII